MKENENLDFCILKYFVEKNSEETGNMNIHRFKEREDFIDYLVTDFGNLVIKRIVERIKDKFIELYRMSI